MTKQLCYVFKKDETSVTVKFSNQSDSFNCVEYFKFENPNQGIKFSKKFRAGLIDNYIRLYNARTQNLPKGLLHYLFIFCKENNLEMKFEDGIIESGVDVSLDYVEKLGNYLKLSCKGETITPYDYQLKAVQHSINSDRVLIKSPTSSGKSLIIYMLLRFYLKKLENEKNNRILIIVPNVGLLNQLSGDFADYSALDDDFTVDRGSINLIGGKHKNFYSGAKIYISTYQSLIKRNKKYFKDINVGCVFVDEAHQSKSDSITKILNNLTETKYRFGLTGTISADNATCTQLQLEAMFGKLFTVITTKELMDAGKVAKLKILVLKLIYGKDVINDVKGLTYQDELNYFIQKNERNKFIFNLVNSFKSGNTLLLFNTIEHGKLLYKVFNQHYENNDKVKVVLWYGGIDADIREKQRLHIDSDTTNTRYIVIASFGTTSTGISIKKLDNLILTSTSKSVIRVLQSIGRLLRLQKKGTNDVKVFDIVDIASEMNNDKQNYLLQHHIARMEIYNKEKFDYIDRIYKI